MIVCARKGQVEKMLTATKTIPETVKKIPMGSKTIFEAR